MKVLASLPFLLPLVMERRTREGAKWLPKDVLHGSLLLMASLKTPVLLPGSTLPRTQFSEETELRGTSGPLQEV